MNILELDSFKLSDAVKFHNRLNPKIWDQSEHLLPEVRSKLMEIAADFQEFLGISDLDVQDITLSGSNAAYSYTPHSDIDLHLVVNVPKDEVYQELFNAKKYQYNDLHDIRIRGADVELYVQPADEAPVSLGEYSVLNNAWIEVPKRKRAKIDQSLVRHKYEDLKARIESALKENDSDRIQALITKIKAMRQSGLDQHGEFGPENLAFKMLRSQGWIKRLYDHVAAAKDRELSLKEQEPKKPVKYGFGSDVADVDDYRAFFKPVTPKSPAPDEMQFNRPQDYEWYMQQQAKKKSLAAEDAGETWDGVNPTTCMVVNEDTDQEQIVHEFIQWAADKLGIDQLPEIFIHTDPEWSVEEHSFGRYEPDTHSLHVNMANRHLFDILRTTAHELAHCKQNQVHELPYNAGDTGSEYENEAHAAAGIIMRDFADAHPELFDTPALKESVTGALNVPNSKVIASAKPIGTISQKPVMKYEQGNTTLFFFVDNNKISALVLVVDGNKLRAIKNYSGQSGQVYALINFIVNINNTRLVVTPDEPLTKEGFQWIARLINSPSGLKVSDFDGNPIDVEALRNEWKKSKSNLGTESGKTGIIISESSLQWKNKLQENETRLMPHIYFNVGSNVVEASGYIPTKRQARDPRYSMALTVDIKPGQVGKEANKMDLQTDSQGHPKMVYKSANQIRESRNDGNEPRGPEFRPTMPKGTVRVNVSDVYDWYKLGKNIANLDRANPADFGKGPPSTIVSFGDEETEHKYIKNLKKLGLTTTDIDPKDPHQPAGLPRQSTDPTYNVDEEEDLVESLRQEFALLEEEYLGEIKMSPTNLRAEAAKTGAQAGMEFEMIVPNVGSVEEDPEPDYYYDESVIGIRDAVNFFDDGDYNSRRAIQRLEDSMREDYESWVMEHFDDYWVDNALELIREYLTLNASDSDIIEILELAGGEAEEVEENGAGKQDYTAAAEKVLEERDSSAWYDSARDAAEQDYLNDTDREEEWLESQGMNSMMDIMNNYDVTWPHWTSGDSGDINVNDVAEDFSNAIGKPINASTSYHGARREAGHYVVEPDGSLEGDDDDDAGLEFVSPPMPIDEMMSDLSKVKAWADARGCYTNKSTGLHINISVPNFSIDKLDYVKLALLLGDKYVLDQYGRASNTYTKSAIGKVQDKVKSQPETAKAMLDKMRGGLDQLASKAIHSGTTDKYTSINTKSGYIEFRSPGGDWLNENFDKIENTLLRFTVALSAAMDPEAYRQEYLKKLYKLLEPTAVETKNPDTIKYFADYVAGKTPKAALRSFVKQAQLQRKIAKDPTGGQKYWWEVSRPGYFASIEVVASSKEEAIDKAIEPGNYPDWARARNTLQAKPIRPYDASPVKATVGAPQPAGGMRPSNPDGNYVIFNNNSRAGDPPAYRFMAANNDDADTVLLQWSREHPGNWEVHYDGNQRLGQPGGNTNTLSQAAAERRMGLPDQTGDANWEIVDRRTGRRVFVMIANTEYDARNKYADWLSAAGYPIETEDYGFREIALPGSTLDLQRQRAQQSDPYRSVPIPGVTDVELDIPMAEPRPLGAGRELVGWEIRIDGQPVHTLSGIGNNQGDANRIAQQWILRQGSSFLRQHQGGEVEVVPAWREA